MKFIILEVPLTNELRKFSDLSINHKCPFIIERLSLIMILLKRMDEKVVCSRSSDFRMKSGSINYDLVFYLAIFKVGKNQYQ